MEGQCTAAGAGDVQVSWETVGGLFIVRFRRYKMAADHRKSLEDGLGGSGLQWQWVDRNNKAALHPTDFGLLRINETEVEQTKASSTRSFYSLLPRCHA